MAIRDVRKSFGGFEALRGVSLDVPPGQVLCLIGASGSGKTTLLRSINQLSEIDSGAIVEQGTPAEVLVTPRETRTRAFLSAVIRR